MSGNKNAKRKLIQRYGRIDFLDELKIVVPSNRRYTSKGQIKKMRQLTYHHILEKSKGGHSTVENGALLTAEHHEWFHQQSPAVQDRLNAAFQKLKQEMDKMQELTVNFTDEDIDLPFDFNTMEISIDKKGKMRTYNRAQIKRRTREMYDKYERMLEERE